MYERIETNVFYNRNGTLVEINRFNENNNIHSVNCKPGVITVILIDSNEFQQKDIAINNKLPFDPADLKKLSRNILFIAFSFYDDGVFLYKTKIHADWDELSCDHVDKSDKIRYYIHNIRGSEKHYNVYDKDGIKVDEEFKMNKILLLDKELECEDL